MCCHKCIFYQEGYSGGKCRRYPPVSPDPSKVWAKHPSVKASDWCGEFKEKGGE